MATGFKNTSIFQGIVEFATATGASFRFERIGGGVWRRYAKRGNAFAYDGTVRVVGRATPLKLWSASEESPAS